MKNKCILISYKNPSLISEIKELVKASDYIIKEIYNNQNYIKIKDFKVNKLKKATLGSLSYTI